MILNIYKDLRNEILNDNTENIHIEDLKSIDRYKYKEIILTHCISNVKLNNIPNLLIECYNGLELNGKLYVTMSDAKELCRYFLFSDLPIDEINKELYFHNAEDICKLIVDNKFKIERKNYNGTECTIVATKHNN